MKATPLETKIAEIIDPVVKDMGLALVSVKMIGEGGSRNLQVMAENPATRNLGVDQCSELSKAISTLLDVEDPIEGHYRLEVSSPGIDRILTKAEDFKIWAGHEARLETDMPNEMGQKRFKGVINGIENDMIKITTDQGETEIPFATIAKAKLVLTDKLLKATTQTNA